MHIRQCVFRCPSPCCFAAKLLPGPSFWVYRVGWRGADVRVSPSTHPCTPSPQSRGEGTSWLRTRDESNIMFLPVWGPAPALRSGGASDRRGRAEGQPPQASPSVLPGPWVSGSNLKRPGALATDAVALKRCCPSPRWQPRWQGLYQQGCQWGRQKGQ